jgi:hypothetical protein
MGRPAPVGDRTIQARIYFWTDGIASEGKGYIEPGVAWKSGTVDIKANRAHGIKAQNDPVPFNSLEDLPVAIEQALARAGVVLRDQRSAGG